MSFKADSPTFTGAVTVPNPSDSAHAASKSYVDGLNSKIKRGSATFTNENSKAVAFSQAFDDANYRIALAPGGDVAVWFTDKLATGFTIHTSANLTGDVDWVAAHD